MFGSRKYCAVSHFHTHIHTHAHTHSHNTHRTSQCPSACCFARARISEICGGPQSRSLTDRVMRFNECIPCWNGPSRSGLAVASCLFNHGGEEGHPPRTGGTMETKVYTLRVDHLEQEILLSIRVEARVRFTKKLNPTANQTNRSRQMMPRNGRSLGSPAKQAGKQWRKRSHFSESHHRRSKGSESRWRFVRAVRVRAGWPIVGSRRSG